MAKRLTKEEWEKRPWLFVTPYDPIETPQALLELMAEGYTNYMIMSELKISESTFYLWTKDYPEFKAAYEYGKAIRQGNYEAQGIRNLENPNFNVNLWKSIGKRYYRYTDYRSIKLPGLTEAKTYKEKAEITITAMANGEICPNEGLIVSQVLSNLSATEVATDITDRITKLEQKNQIEAK